MIGAYIISESLRAGASLTDLDATLVEVSRDVQGNATPNQPRVWTRVRFETNFEPTRLASKLAEILDDNPAWYSHFRAGEEIHVVFPHRIFRYQAGDKAGREGAQDYARSIGVPQIDWDEE